jgi:hypothetical protein
VHSITHGSYKDVDSAILETDALRLALVPEHGAKLASLIHKPTGREVFFQLPGEKFIKGTYAGFYPDAEVSGFDDMFPTITECYCDVEPWAGIKMPDHGELWSLPCKLDICGSDVRTSVTSPRFPYTFTRTIKFEHANSILLRYKVENHSAFGLPVMWAAHPLLNMTPGSRIILPESARNIMNTVPGPALGAYGNRFSFPHASTADGKTWDLSEIGSIERKAYFKYFFMDDFKEGFGILHDPKTRETVGFSWPVAQVPYLGMWVNEGGMSDIYHMAFEPCTAPFDRWDIARQWGKLPVIPPFGSHHWELRLTVGLYDHPQRVNGDGTIS